MTKAPTPEQIAEAIRHLRSIGSFTRDSAYGICNEAADLIEALAARLAEARGQLRYQRILTEQIQTSHDLAATAVAEAREAALEAARRLETMAVLAEGNVAGGVLPRDAVITVVNQCLKQPPAPVTPLDVVLFCPHCKAQHVDKPEPERGWTNPPHKSHLCHNCGAIWRPADVPTNGVAASKTVGRADRQPLTPQAPAPDTHAVRNAALEEAAKIFDERAVLHAKDATWMGRERQKYDGARINGVEMTPMNGPAISYDRETANAAAIRALKSTPPAPATPLTESEVMPDTTGPRSLSGDNATPQASTLAPGADAPEPDFNALGHRWAGSIAALNAVDALALSREFERMYRLGLARAQGGKP